MPGKIVRKSTLRGRFMIMENGNVYIKNKENEREQFYRNNTSWVIYDPCGCRVTTVNRERKFRYYDVHAEIYGQHFCIVHILRRSRRLRKYTAVYGGIGLKKKECPICRRNHHMLYKCNVCSYRMCRKCVIRTQEKSLDCVVCKVGMMPWSAEM
jgi:hypothetical protein